MSMRQRITLGFTPEWDGPIKGWARRFIGKNRWRCDPIHDIEDLMQDAYLIYLKVVDCYPAVRDPKHFMRLYQATLKNEIHQYSRQMQARKNTLADTEADAIEFNNWGYIAALLAEAPEELRLALAVYANPAKCAELAAEPKRPRFSRRGLVLRENLNRKLSRLAGLDIDFNVVKALREMLS